MARELDDADKALLTAEEIAAMEEDGAEDLDVRHPHLADDEDEDDAPEDGADEDEDEDDAGDDPAAAAEKAGGEPEPAPEQVAFTPSFTEADAAQLETINARRDEITTQADDGELSFAEARAKLEEIDKEAGLLIRKQIADEERGALVAEQNARAWDGVVSDVLAEAGVDIAKMSDDHVDALDAISRAFTGNAALSGKMSWRDQAVEVFRLFATQNPAAWTGKKVWEAPTAEAKPKQSKRGVSEVLVPPSLGGLPASDPGGGIEDGRFAALDRLADSDPMRFEREFAKLSPESQNAYLSS